MSTFNVIFLKQNYKNIYNLLKKKNGKFYS